MTWSSISLSKTRLDEVILFPEFKDNPKKHYLLSYNMEGIKNGLKMYLKSGKHLK